VLLKYATYQVPQENTESKIESCNIMTPVFYKLGDETVKGIQVGKDLSKLPATGEIGFVGTVG